MKIYLKRIVAITAALLMLALTACTVDNEPQYADVSETVDGNFGASSSVNPETAEPTQQIVTTEADEELEIALPESDTEALERNLYEAVLRIDPQTGTLKGQLRLHYLNNTEDTLHELKLWLYPNALAAAAEAEAQASPAPSPSPAVTGTPAPTATHCLTLTDLTLNGETAYYTLSEDGALLSIPLSADLLPGEQATLYLSYSIAIPAAANFFGYTDNSVMLGWAFPTAVMYEDHAWRLDEFNLLGDPFYSDVADYKVIVARPEAYSLAATGSVQEERTEKGTALSYVTAEKARDLTITLIKDAVISTAEADGGVKIYAMATTAEKAEFLSFTARIALNYYSALIGQYPYERFCLVETELEEGYGMEYTGLVMLSGDYMSGDNEDFGRLMIAHETAHQWFYAVVGTDQINEPWVDEAICEFISYDQLGMIYGKGLPKSLYEARFEDIENFDYPVPMDSPVSAFDTRTYFWTIFGGGSAMMESIYEEIGQANFYAVLRALYSTHEFGFLTGQEVIDAFVKAGGRSVKNIFDKYMA